MSSQPPFRNGSQATSTGARTTLLVFSHLRWGFVFQRPQHVLTRLATHCDVLFVEEPVFDPGPPRLETNSVSLGVEVLTPHLPDPAPGFADVHLMPLGRMVAALLAERRVRDPLVWFYTPMALPLLKYLEPRGVVYDCMDDLASFRFAPPELLARESKLLDIADVVLAGGPSLHEARKGRRSDAHCLPSAVDVDHFAPAALERSGPEVERAKALHADIRSPRLGFMGVIDERIDLQLVDDLAARRPDWSLVMVGPVVKIDERSLPRRPNIHWLGMASYGLLPYLMPHWDVALMPFALNDATRFISPTKTLEYLAGGLDVISTPVPDVVSLYAPFVRIAEGAAGFESAFLSLSERSASACDQAARSRRSVLARSTWDAMVGRVVAALRPWLDDSSIATPEKRSTAASHDEGIVSVAARSRMPAG